MALADYFHRAAIAASQAVAGFDEDAIRERLQDVRVGVSAAQVETDQGRDLLDMTIRLLARLYPTLVIEGQKREAAAELARQINPNIEIATGDANIAIAIGSGERMIADTTIFAGCDGWKAQVGTEGPFATGEGANPFGAGVAACLAAANVFRAVFLANAPTSLDSSAEICALHFAEGSEDVSLHGVDIGDAVLVGAGAIGQAALWALSRTSAVGRLHVIDPELVELGNLQRYVLATPDSEGRPKTALLPESQRSGLDYVGHQQSWEQFCQASGYEWERVLVGVDSAAARRAVQASLPRWIANAWTQPEDLGVSVHPWTECGACLSCLYLPASKTPNEDETIAAALGLEVMEVRRLLVNDQPMPSALLETVERHLHLPEGSAAAFAGRMVRELYVDGVCGGALLSLDRAGRPAQDVHVPVAHQSALAGVLLASRLIADALHEGPGDSTVAQIDLMRTLPEEIVHPAQKDSRGICICQDPVYRAAYHAKWSAG
jgi:molybdopterin/thiamine biosynthesis adenylyltransferase